MNFFQRGIFYIQPLKKKRKNKKHKKKKKYPRARNKEIQIKPKSVGVEQEWKADERDKGKNEMQISFEMCHSKDK